MSPGLFVLLLALLADEPATQVRWPPATVPAEQAGETEPSAPEGLMYPLGARSTPDFLAPGDPFKLVGLRYGFSDTFSTTHTFAARVRVEGWGYLGAEFEGERKGVTLTGPRLDLAASGENGAYDLLGRYRGSRLIVSTRARKAARSAGGGWLLDPSLSVRLSPDLELVGRVAGDTSRPDARFLRSASLGFFWQRGTRFEAAGEYVHEYVSTDGRFENTRNTGTVSLLGQVRALELSGEAFLEDTAGPFPRREAGGSLQARLPLGGHLLVEGGARGRFEVGLNNRSREYRGALTWSGRHFTLPRTGEAAERTVGLARKATEMGYNERRVFGDDERRAQRERLSLLRRREELGDDMAALYRAQVAERAVPLLGAEMLDRTDALAGVSSRTARLFVGVPWPPAWPWQASESAVPFLRLGLERGRETSGAGFRAITWGGSLTASLNREMDLVLRYRHIDPTPVEIIRGIGKRRTIELSYVYALGR